ncbi:DUF3892 domain-containing protein [Listeria monocytogenes]|nr:DUF3892 domain-containing protein [Listeria monocytogenes]
MSRITHIRLSESYATSTDRITHVKIDTGATETVEQVVRYIDNIPMEYYYTSSNESKAIVETVHPFNGKPYIRTKANYTTSDNLLSLPRF